MDRANGRIMTWIRKKTEKNNLLTDRVNNRIMTGIRTKQ
jgi:hypothetical protein